MAASSKTMQRHNCSKHAQKPTRPIHMMTWWWEATSRTRPRGKIAWKHAENCWRQSRTAVGLGREKGEEQKTEEGAFQRSGEEDLQKSRLAVDRTRVQNHSERRVRRMRTFSFLYINVCNIPKSYSKPIIRRLLSAHDTRAHLDMRRRRHERLQWCRDQEIRQNVW